jgi:hypothetical protein
MVNIPGPNWRLLAPHRPLGPDDQEYVARPVGGGDAIAAWVLAGGHTVLVSGPTGVGKSTELARAMVELDAERVTCLVQVDRLTNIHKLTPDELIRLLLRALIDAANVRGLALSHGLVKAVQSATAPGHLPYLPLPMDVSVLRAAIDEITRLAAPRRIAFLIDGFERLVVGSAPEIFDALSQLQESIDLIVVIPWHAAFGGNVQQILRAGERLHRVLALEIHGPTMPAAEQFASRVLTRRLKTNLPPSMPSLVDAAFHLSGGLPRTFLQLMADAGTYARVKRAEDWPENSDLLDAARDQQDSFRRALLPGDAAAIGSVAGTDGRELDLERRIRLVAQGILLERVRGGRVVFEAHPLVAPILRDPKS